MSDIGRLVALVTAFLTAALLGGCAAPVAAPTTFRNPIKDIGNDPYIVQQGGFYYLVESWDGGIWITKSVKDNLTDLAWSGDRVKVWSYPTTGTHCADVWAPELHPIGDRWYIYYAATTCDKNNVNHRMFALESTGTDPLGGYLDRGLVTDATNTWAIDGTRFEYRGRSYFVWSGWPGETDGQQNLYIAEMSSPVTIVGSRTLIAEPTHAWEKHGQPTDEGPEVLARDSSVHIVFSASGSWTDAYCYGLLTLTGTDPLDPSAWTKPPSPVFASTTDVFGPGHGSFVKSPDGTEDWMIYHSARSSGSGWDRMMNAQRYTWRDGVPVFGEPIPPSVPQKVPSGQLEPIRGHE